MQTATLKLVEFPELNVKCLAGVDDASGEWTFVLRKTDEVTYTLCYSATSAADQELRSFLTADQSLSCELAKTVLESCTPTELERAKRNRSRLDKKRDNKSTKSES